MSLRAPGSVLTDPRSGAGERRLRRDERRPVAMAVVASLAAALPTAAVAWLVAGGPGFVGALIGSALVLVLFGVGAALMLWAGRRGPSAVMFAGALGVGGRLMLYASVLLALDGADIVHRPSLAAATAITLVITLAAEIAVLARTPSLYRLRVPEGAPSARPARPTPSDPTRPDPT